MDVFEKMEKAILDFELLLDVSVTIIDRDGVLHSETGYPLFSRFRQSHRKNRICDIDFCARCVEHCRHDMNAEGEKLGRFFISECWKGTVEIVVPIMRNGAHLGSFFVGVWKKSETEIGFGSRRVSDRIIAEYTKLQEFDSERCQAIGRMASVFVRGLLDELSLSKGWDDVNLGYRGSVARFIHNSAASSPRLADLASELSLSPSRCSHLVKELFGVSFTDLLTSERIRRARTMLLSTDYTVGEIAEKIGISDEYHFNKVFKRHVGLPPGRFRKEWDTSPKKMNN
jgi:AraC-like DNA-binding protein